MIGWLVTDCQSAGENPCSHSKGSLTPHRKTLGGNWTCDPLWGNSAKRFCGKMFPINDFLVFHHDSAYQSHDQWLLSGTVSNFLQVWNLCPAMNWRLGTIIQVLKEWIIGLIKKKTPHQHWKIKNEDLDAQQRLCVNPWLKAALFQIHSTVAFPVR